MDNKKRRGILILAIRAIGDMVLITPVIRHLKQTFPDSSLVVLADGLSAQVLEQNPHLDRIIVIDRASTRRLSWIRRMNEWLQLVALLRREQFDLVIDLFGGPRSALLGWMSGAPERYGEARRHRMRGLLYNRPIPVRRDGRHLVEQKLELVRPLIGSVERNEAFLEIVLTPEEQRQGERLLESVRGTSSPLVGLVPNAGSSWRMWPVERFAELADRLVKTVGARIVLVGGPQDQVVCRRLAESMTSPALNLAGRTTLRESMAVLQQLDLVIANVTGPMHLAVALNRPQVIALYGAADTVQYAPWGSRATMVTKGTAADAYWRKVDYQRDYEFLLNISVDEVIRHVQQRLSESVASRS